MAMASLDGRTNRFGMGHGCARAHVFDHATTSTHLRAGRALKQGGVKEGAPIARPPLKRGDRDVGVLGCCCNYEGQDSCPDCTAVHGAMDSHSLSSCSCSSSSCHCSSLRGVACRCLYTCVRVSIKCSDYMFLYVNTPVNLL